MDSSSNTWKLYLQLGVSASLIIWGCEDLPRLASRPEMAISWVGLVLIVLGAAGGARAAYVARRGAPALGVALLIAAGAWAWNARIYFDPTRYPGGQGPPLGSYFSIAILILLGVLFTVFFRYLYPTGDSPLIRGREEGPQSPAPSSRPSGRRSSKLTPWYRLGLVASAAALAIVAGRLSGIDDPGRTQLTILVLVLGCLATGLISEETLVKLVPEHKK